MLRLFIKTIFFNAAILLLAACVSTSEATQRLTATTVVPTTEPSQTRLPSETPSPVPTAAPTFTPTPLTICSEKAGEPFYAEFQPVDGTGKIAYSGDGLTLIDPETSQMTSIHPLAAKGDHGWDTGIVWSLDGNQIVFLYSEKGRQPDPQFIVFIADLAAGKACPLILNPGRYSLPAWSPDGKSIAVTEGASGALILVNIYDQNFSTLENDAMEGTSPQWIDNKTVAYVKNKQDGKADLVLRAVDGSASSTLLQDVPGLRDFLTSPDGEWLSYYASGLKLHNLSTQQETNLGDMLPVAWSGNSQMLITKAGMGGVFLHTSQNDFSPSALPVWGFPDRQSFSLNGRDLALEISGDGNKLSKIGIWDTSSAQLKELEIPDLYPSNPAWSPK